MRLRFGDLKFLLTTGPLVFRTANAAPRAARLAFSRVPPTKGYVTRRLAGARVDENSRIPQKATGQCFSLLGTTPKISPKVEAAATTLVAAKQSHPNIGASRRTIVDPVALMGCSRASIRKLHTAVRSAQNPVTRARYARSGAASGLRGRFNRER